MANQYFLETGEMSVKVSDLVGTDAYICPLNSVAGESYLDMVITAKMGNQCRAFEWRSDFTLLLEGVPRPKKIEGHAPRDRLDTYG